MPGENDYFLALQAFQAELQAVHSLDALSACATAFLQRQFPAAEVAIRETAVAPAPNTHSLPLSQTGYFLTFSQPAPLDPAAESFLQMAVALMAASPYCQNRLQQTRQLFEELDTLQTIITPALPLQPVAITLERIHQQIINLFTASTCYIALYDAQTRQIRFPYVYETEYSEQWEPISSLDDNSLTAWVILNNRPFLTGNWAEEEKPVPGIIDGTTPNSILAVPIATPQEVVGVLSLQSEQKNAYSLQDLQHLQTAASHIATIVHNAQLYEQARALVEQGVRDYQTAVSLRQAIAVVGASLDVNTMTRNLLLALANLFVFDTAYVFIQEDGAWHYVNGYDYYERPLTHTPAQIQATWQNSPLLQRIQKSKEPLILANVQQEADWPSGWEPQTQSWMGIPLVLRSQLVGIMIISSHSANAFAKHEAWLAMTLASHTAVALQNAQLHQQTELQLQELSTLYQASATMTANLDQDFVLQTVASEMVRATQVDSCTIFVWDQTSPRLTLAAHENQTRARSTESAISGLGTLANLEQYPIIQRVLETQEIHSLRLDNAYSPHQVALLEAANLSSILLVPLSRRGTILGLMGLGQESQARTFSNNDLRLIQNLAEQAAVAIEHARLFSQSQRRIEELATFHKVVLQLNAPLKLSVVLDTITEAAMKLVDANNVIIYLYSAESQTFAFGSALWRDGSRRSAVTAPRASGITTLVAKQGKPIVINDARTHPLFQEKSAQAWGIHAIAGFPLKQDDQVIGVFTTAYLHPHTFSEDELLLLNLLTDQAAIAVKNARLYAQSQRQLRDMSGLVDMAKQITSNLNLSAVLQTTVQILQKLLGARASTITMLSKDGTELVVEAATGISQEFMHARMKLGEGVSGEVVRRGTPIYIRDTYSEPDFLFFDEVVRSLLVVPLVIRNETWGTMTVDSDRPNAFNRADIQLMTIAAAQVSIAISNARLFEELEERAAELAVAYEELKENDRLKDELVQNVSHELRTPLTFVKGYVDLLLEGEMGLLNQEQQNALQIVATKTDEITRLIADIMTLQRIDSTNLERENTAVNELIENAIIAHRLVAEKKGLVIEANLPDTPTILYIDKGRINQVLDNLIGNALKFSPDGGTVTITLQDEADKIQVSIADQGIGIPPDKLQRVFDRFYQVDGSSRRRFGGTGLGLAIVKRIIDAHQGAIWVESEVNLGSTFHFVLPKEAQP